MLLDRSTWPLHRPWLIGCTLALAGSIAWFVIASIDAVDWPGGNSIPGFTFGVAGAFIIIFEFLLYFRKKVRAWAIGSARAWLRAHIWLGLLCLPLLILHSGLRFGGTLTTVLMVLLILVVVSGVWGVLLQNLLPRTVIGGVSSDTTYAAMDALADQLLVEAEQLISATCGKTVGAETGREAVGPMIVVGPRVVRSRAPAAPILETEALAAFYLEEVLPFLRGNDSPLAHSNRAAVLFASVKTQVPPAAHYVVDALESVCNQRRHWDRQARVHFWLHNWLWVHYPLSVALLVLMLAHIVVALKYW